MSLKAVHICFIVLSIALAAGFGYWALAHPAYLYLGIISFAGALALALYLFRFTQKMKKIHPPFVWILGAGLFSSRSLFACSVCFGDPQSSLSRGVIAGVLVLLGVVAFVLGWIATLIFVWARKARKIKGISASLDPAARLD